METANQTNRNFKSTDPRSRYETSRHLALESSRVAVKGEGRSDSGLINWQLQYPALACRWRLAGVRGFEVKTLTLAEELHGIVVHDLTNQAFRMPASAHLEDKVGHGGRLRRAPVAG